MLYWKGLLLRVVIVETLNFRAAVCTSVFERLGNSYPSENGIDTKKLRAVLTLKFP